MVLVLFGCGVLALIHQVAVNSYPAPQFLLPIWGEDGIAGVRAWVLRAEPLLVVALGVAAIGGWRIVAAGPESRAWRIAAISSAALIGTMACAWLYVLASRFDPRLVVEHLHWLGLYLPRGLLFGALGGLALCAWPLWRYPERRTLLGVPVVIATLTLVGFVIAPLVTPQQPWAIRRAVPVVLPVFMMAALLGWKEAFAALAERLGRPRLAHGYLALVVVALVVLWRWAGPVVREPLLVGTGAQVESFAAKLPPRALVLMPNGDSGLHLQVGLEYHAGRSVLLLPENASFNAPETLVARQFLDRQAAAGRPLIAVVQNRSLLPSAFVVGRRPQYLRSERLSFREIMQVGARHFPGVIRDRDVDLHVFEARDADTAGKLPKLQLGDPVSDLPYLVGGFYGPEGNRENPASLFRWTTGKAELQLPRAANVRLLVDPRWRPREMAARYAVRIDGAEAPFQLVQGPAGRTFIEVRVPEAGRGKPLMLVELECEPFSPRELGISQDARQLGVPLFWVELRD